MAGIVTLLSDRPGFEPVWRPALESQGLTVLTAEPTALAMALDRGGAVVLDALAQAFDEDELLTAVGLASAMNVVAAVALGDGDTVTVDDVFDEMSAGLVARSDDDISRVAAGLARRLDPERASRFEFLTVSPRAGELLAIVGSGRAVLLPRPVNAEDDGSDVVEIALGAQAASATVALASGVRFELSAPRLASPREPSLSNGHHPVNGITIDGARLGARLRELRREAGLTQAELARRTGIHRPNIARVEAGRHTPSLETLARLASAIGVPTTRVLSDES